MEKTISLRFKYTEEEYVAAMRLYVTRETDALIRFVISSLFMAAGIFLVLLAELDSVLTFVLIFITVIWVLIGLLSLFVLPRRSFRSDPKFRDEYLLQFSEDGIQFKTVQIDALIQWSLYTKVLEDDRFYLMVYGKNMISVIPKRAFTSAAQATAFDALLTTKLPARTDLKRLKTSKPTEQKKPYVPPAEPPDWR